MIGEAELAIDPRFGFAYRLPPSGRANRPLLIAIHGSDRIYRETRDAFAELADQHDLAILAPLFAEGAANPGVGDGYKFLVEPGANYLDILAAMQAQFSQLCPFDAAQVYLFGFSGGGQFAQRFGIVQASTLAGLVIAAPGSVTLIDNTLPYWPGTGDIATILGRPLDVAGLTRIPVHLIIGGEDRAAGLVERSYGAPYYAAEANLAGTDRHERIATLQRNLITHGIKAPLTTLDGVGHDFAPIARCAAGILSGWLDAANLAR
ncbi:Poly(3-hydroxybutyrate) depolymerase [Devosia sp. LC5]|uniref:hypothetical protein n=1 Tax=Devosia sp. LC5 TaxID=1502724 RepID=UPI0004E367F6|nr:hypothetical protein [Devosia sp. LC5]KFC67197.1 Poly(3-hydroxybutyrate) depolymerase [Devosia sp. LC5]